MTEAQQFIKSLKDKCIPTSLANGIVVYKFNGLKLFQVKNNRVYMDTYQVKVKMENNGISYNDICDGMKEEFGINDISNWPLNTLPL